MEFDHFTAKLSALLIAIAVFAPAILLFVYGKQIARFLFGSVLRTGLTMAVICTLTGMFWHAPLLGPIMAGIAMLIALFGYFYLFFVFNRHFK